MGIVKCGIARASETYDIRNKLVTVVSPFMETFVWIRFDYLCKVKLYKCFNFSSYSASAALKTEQLATNYHGEPADIRFC